MFSKLRIYTLLFVFFIGQLALAQPPEGEEDPDPVAARLDLYLMVLLIMGVFLAFSLFKRDFIKKDKI